MEEYKPNSHKSKEAELATSERKFDKVVTGTSRTKKKSEVRKFADVFISEDIANVKSYIISDVLIPTIKKAISDIVTNGIDMILYGEAGSGRKRSSASKISYNSYYDEPRNRRSPSRVSNGFDYDEIVFDNRGDAEAVLTALDEGIVQYGFVSVGDLYDLAEISTTNYMVNKYGWTDLRSAQVLRGRDGYMIKLPRALPLK